MGQIITSQPECHQVLHVLRTVYSKLHVYCDYLLKQALSGKTNKNDTAPIILIFFIPCTWIIGLPQDFYALV